VNTGILKTKTLVLLLNGCLFVDGLALGAQQEGKPRKHAMPMPGMQMGHENHTAASDLRSALAKNWNAGESEKSSGLFVESAIIILPTGKLITGRQSIREFLNDKAKGNVQLTLTSIGFDPSSDMQVDFGVFSETKVVRESAHHSAGQNSEESNQNEGKYLMVVKRPGADWKIQEVVFVTQSRSF